VFVGVPVVTLPAVEGLLGEDEMTDDVELGEVEMIVGPVMLDAGGAISLEVDGAK